MKKILSVLLAALLVCAFVACGEKETAETTAADTTVVENVVESVAETTAEVPADTTVAETTVAETTAEVADVAVMSYSEYAAAELDTPVKVECYVQAHQSWWDNKVTVYAQDADGAYFIYEMACSEEDAAKLVPGTKIVVTGYKAAWAGEVEIVDATFEFVEGADTFVAEAMDATALLGTEELINHQNKFVTFKGLTVSAIEFKNGESGDDIYVTVSKDGTDYSFCVERYLTGPETEVYAAVSALKAGDVIDVDGFLYWYEGVNTHITAVTVAQ